MELLAKVVGPCLLALMLGGQLGAQPIRLVTSDYPPFSFEESGQQKGIAVDVIREAFRRMKVPVVLEFVPFVRAIEMVKAGTADGIFPFAVSDDRKEFAQYSKEPVITDPGSLFVRADSKLTFDGDYSKLAGKTIGMMRGTNHGPAFMDALDRYHIVTDVAEDQKRNILKLTAGRFDIAVGPLLVVRYAAKQVGKGAEIKLLYQGISEGLAFLGTSRVRQHESILARFDVIVRQMRQDGGYEAILQRYR